jgi:hypothetical protein
MRRENFISFATPFSVCGPSVLAALIGPYSGAVLKVLAIALSDGDGSMQPMRQNMVRWKLA